MVLYYVHVTVWLYAGILMICGWVQITKIFMYLPKMVFKRLSYFMVIILKFSTTWSNVRKLYEKVTQEEIDNWNSPMEILKLGYNCFTVLSWFLPFQFSSVASHVRLFATPWTAAHQASLSITNFWSSLKLMFIQSVMPSNHLILCHPLFFLASIFPSIRAFSNESALHIRWPKYWSFSFSISPSNEHSGLISFRMDWLDLLAVQETLKSLLQHHSSKASILGCSAFFIVQLSHPYVTNGKTIALTRQTAVGKVMSLLFNMLSRLVIAFLPGSWKLFFHSISAIKQCKSAINVCIYIPFLLRLPPTAPSHFSP